MLLNPEQLTYETSNGQQIPNITAQVSSKGVIITEATTIPFKEGEKFIRQLPNMSIETFVIDDIQFQKGLGPIHDHYRLEVHKQGKEKKAVKQINVQVTGTGARVNIDSHDQSTNIIVERQDEVFEALRKALAEHLGEGEEREALIRHVTAMEATRDDKPSFIQKYQEFLDLAARHMTIIGPLLPVLSRFLG